MDMVYAAHRLATDTNFATYVASAAYDDGYANTQALLTLIHSDPCWRQLCDPASSDKQLLGWSAPVSRQALRGIQRLWDNAGMTGEYRSALDAALPRTHSTAVAAGHPLLSDLPSLCYAAAGGTSAANTALLESWNVLYAALHLFDDLEDGDATAVAARYGHGAAINIATGLLASTQLALAELERDGIAAHDAQRIRTQFNRTLLQMCAGQHGDLTCNRPGLEQCWQIADAKSGAFFALACEAGARAAGADDEDCTAWHCFGHALGRLVQIGDDLSGLWPNEHGRSDLQSGERWTLPIAYTMQVLDGAERARLQSMLRSAAVDAHAEREARRMVVAAGGVLYLAAEAEYQRATAERLVAALARSETARTSMLRLLDELMPRRASSACLPAAAGNRSILAA